MHQVFSISKTTFCVCDDGELQIEIPAISHAPDSVIDWLEPDDQRELFRYLAGIVLPKVERVETPALNLLCFESDKTTGAIMDLRGNVRLISLGSDVGDAENLTSAQARALAACLLAAADEADATETTKEAPDAR